MKLTLLITAIALIKLTPAFSAPVLIEVNLGDRTTRVKLQDEDQKYTMAIGSNDLREHKTDLRESNFLYIEKRLGDISKLDAKKVLCNRERVEVKKQEKGAWVPRFEVCLLENSDRAESMRSLLNTLSIAY